MAARNFTCPHCGTQFQVAPKAKKARTPRESIHRDRATYETWRQMKKRCFTTTNKNYSSYGGRGITVCERWRDSFDDFLADMGPKPSSDYSIDRVDPDGNYEPSNCRWATRYEQAETKRGTVLITLFGVAKTKTRWMSYAYVNRSAVRARMARGWSFEDALFTPASRGPEAK